MPLLLKGWLLIVAEGCGGGGGGVDLDNEVYEKEWVKCKIECEVKRKNHIHKYVQVLVTVSNPGVQREVWEVAGVKRQWKAWGVKCFQDHHEEMAKWRGGCRH